MLEIAIRAPAVPNRNAVPAKASLQRWTHGLVNRIVMVIDAMGLIGATFAYWERSSFEHRSFTGLQAWAIAAITVIGFHAVMDWTQSYRVERYARINRSLADAFIGLLGGSVPAAIIIAAFLPDAAAHRDWLLGWSGASGAGLLAGRCIARSFVWFIQKNALLRRRVIVVGDGPEADRIIRRLRDPVIANDYKFLGRIDPVTIRFAYRYGLVADRAADCVDLTQFAQRYAVDLVIIALPWERSAEIVDLTRRLQWIAADVVVPFELGGLSPQIAPPMGFADQPLLQLMRRPFKGSQALFKVAEDYVVAIFALIAVSPLMLAAAIAIRLEGPGPILFRQPRVGFNSKPFMIYKFRTMTVDPTDDGSHGTDRDNQRITRIGALLRRTSIDELPQLLNVLRGEMSIVGPRPHVSNMLVGDGVYSEVVQQYAARHRIKPGITGWAQINGMRGGIDSLEKAKRGADLDLFY
ncbi:MAG TPA: exopolysaccharide biosynthesis polyprenyl glycosylphosphotransferase, partial [Rhodopila sp.]|nr:exopolysaccharide biosynthesis polyprenyl glycosylphosphotransferase [Rhodopila sp.]